MKNHTRTTEIEWTDHTWNPFVGCTPASIGCKNCYASRQAQYIEQVGMTPHYRGLTGPTGDWSGSVVRSPPHIFRKPLTRQYARGCKVFVNSMSDFFHPAADPDWRLHAMDIIRQRPDIHFQILTKRADLMAEFCIRHPVPPNVWMGVTVETAGELHRIEALKYIKAKVKFVSFEPLLGQIIPELDGIDWTIIGGESGMGARPMKAGWVRSILAEATAARSARFFKQWGTAKNNPLWETLSGPNRSAQLKELDPVGKGGSLIDGRSFKEFPIVS